MRAVRAAACLAVAVLAAGCATLPPAPAQVQAWKAVWQERRAAFTDVRALADVQVRTEKRGELWPAFTAVFAHTAPDRTTITGFNAFGAPLFAYEVQDGRYTLRTPDREAPRTGRLDRPLADPSLRLLRDLRHLLDGVLGPETGPGPLRIDRQGRWVVKYAGETVRLTTRGGRVTAVSVHRGRGETVALTFTDFRDATPPGESPGVEAPHRIEARLPALGARVEIAVSDWVLGTGTPKNTGGANAAGADTLGARSSSVPGEGHAHLVTWERSR